MCVWVCVSACEKNGCNGRLQAILLKLNMCVCVCTQRERLHFKRRGNTFPQQTTLVPIALLLSSLFVCLFVCPFMVWQWQLKFRPTRMPLRINGHKGIEKQISFSYILQIEYFCYSGCYISPTAFSRRVYTSFLWMCFQCCSELSKELYRFQ